MPCGNKNICIIQVEFFFYFSTNNIKVQSNLQYKYNILSDFRNGKGKCKFNMRERYFCVGRFITYRIFNVLWGCMCDGILILLYNMYFMFICWSHIYTVVYIYKISVFVYVWENIFLEKYWFCMRIPVGVNSCFLLNHVWGNIQKCDFKILKLFLNQDIED